jgi:flagellar L-ring protein precursor FlgH
MRREFKKWIGVLFLALNAAGCAQFLPSLRRDFSPEGQEPTTGGRFSERGMLDGGEGRSREEPGEGSRWGRNAEAPSGTEEGSRGLASSVGDEDPGLRPTSSKAASVLPGNRRSYRSAARATRADFSDDGQNEGSLWASDGQTNYYFTKNKVRSVGDLVSIKVEGEMLKDIGQEIKKTLTRSEREMELELAEERQKAAQKSGGAQDRVASSAAAPNRADAGSEAGKDTGRVSPGDVDVLKSLSVKEGDLIMAEILERYPNGNYRIRGSKRLAYKLGSSRMVSIVAIAKGADIGEDDTITSGKLYEYRLEAQR